MCSTSRQITAPHIIPPPVSLENTSRLDPAIKRKLIDLKKVRGAPVLCLEINPLYKRRYDRRYVEVSSETMSTPITMEGKELRVPFLPVDKEAALQD